MPQDLTRTFRWLRKSEGAPAHVSWAWAGPPDLDLEDRGQFLASIRAAISAAGFELIRIRSSFRHRVIKEGEEAVAEAVAQEGRADAAGHWWVGHLLWEAQDGSVVVGLGDPDGYDLFFQGWGPGSDLCLEVIRGLLADKHPPIGS